MAQVQLGGGFYCPAPGLEGQNPSTGNTTAVAATNDSIAIIGRVQFGDGTSAAKNLQKVAVFFGTTVRAGATVLTVSHQGVSHAAGVPAQPNGTVGGSVTLTMGTDITASNQWVQTGNFSSTRSVSPGDEVAIEIKMGTRGGTDTYTLNCMSLSVAPHSAIVVNAVSGTYTAQNLRPNILLVFDDGTTGTLAGALPNVFSGGSMGTQAFNSGSSPNEYGVQWTATVPCVIDGIWFLVNPASNAAAFNLVLYRGTSALATMSFDAHALAATASRIVHVHFAPQTFAINDVVTASVVPTTVNNVTLLSSDVNANANYGVHPLGTGCVAANRAGGAWTTVTTRRFFGGFHFSSVSDGTGAGGGILVNDGFNGGFTQ